MQRPLEQLGLRSGYHFVSVGLDVVGFIGVLVGDPDVGFELMGDFVGDLEVGAKDDGCCVGYFYESGRKIFIHERSVEIERY